MYSNKNLSNIIYQYENENFSYGKFDCAIFAASIIDEYADKNLLKLKEDINYTNYRGAMKALKNLKCETLEDLFGIILNKPKKDISKVKLGEPVYYINESGEGIIGICNGVRAYFIQIGGGLTTRPITDCLYCWSIK